MLSKREHLARHAASLGVTRALESLQRRPSLIVLNYHRIGTPALCAYDRGVIDATPEEFDARLEYLKRRFHITDLEEVHAILDERRTLRHVHVLITFDDGYRDVHDVALPILRRHGVSAAFFLSTAFVGTNAVPWWDQIAFAARSSKNHKLRLTYPAEISLNRTELGMEETIRCLLKLYKHPSTTEPLRFLSSVEEATSVALPVEADERLFLSWDEAAALVRAGMMIGSHTRRHEPMAKLPEDEQRVECVRSREILEAQLGVTVDRSAAVEHNLHQPKPFQTFH